MRYPKIYYVSRLVPPYRGMCVPPFGIFIKAQYKGDRQILLHDLVHWRQYKRMGLVLYYLRYFAQIILIGYDLMPMEMEARQHDKVKYNYSRKYHRRKCL